MKKKVLILSDGKMGHQNQSVRLAEGLNADYDILQLERRKGAKIFSKIFPLYIIKNARELKSQVLSTNYDAVIGLGTAPRLALVALKKQNANFKTICIMDPKSNYKYYDAIIAPNHDSISYRGDNLLRVTGALSYFRDGDLDESKKEFKKEFTPFLKKPLIGLVIGGNAGCYDFTMLKAQDLLDKTFILANKLGSKIYGTTSRRTPLTQTNFIKYRIEESENKVYTLEGSNPFRAIMGYSSIIVITPETVSMLMESCATEALVLISDRKSVKSKRIKKFIQELLDKNMLLDLDDVICKDKDELLALIEQAKQKPKFKELEKAIEFIKSRNIL